MSAVPVAEIVRRSGEIRDAISRAARSRGRDPAAVALMAVTKGHSAATVANAAGAGLTLFGENRVQEGAAKIESLRAGFPQIIWHLIGPLQTNKAKTALQCFQVLESLDRERLAGRLESLLAAEGRILPVLIEVNLAKEPSKSGVFPEDAPRLCEAALACAHLDVRGLMAVPPFDEDPEKSRPYFRQLRQLRDRLAEQFARPLPELSMGMSHDYAVAVEEGTTEVRVGTALFGPREPL
ncbi:MAG: YggS family pyridoxal phosphate-dependent enzyme [Acidobacteriota bacterium]